MGYIELLEDLKDRIRHAQVRAATAVSRELNLLYFEIGQRIVERQEQEGWGRSVIERLAADLQRAFPGVSGFSVWNIWRMRAFYLAYTQEVTNLAEAVPDLGGTNLPQIASELDAVSLPQPVAEMDGAHPVSNNALGLSDSAKAPIVAFRSAKRRLFAERTTTLRARDAQVDIA